MLIVARGGGSLEDLWSFNEEIVVRAAAESLIPLVAAVGHETDWSLLDLAADVRAPTPTAAAEMSVPVRSELLARLADLDGRGRGAMLRLAQRRRGDLRALARALPSGEDILAGPAPAARPGALGAEGEVARGDRCPRARPCAAVAAPCGALAPCHGREPARAPPRARAPAGTGGRGADAKISRRADAGRERARSRGQRATPDGGASGSPRAAQRWAATLRAEARRGRERAAALPVIEGRLRKAFGDAVLRRRVRFAALAQLLGAVSYRGVLARGFALVRDERDAPIKRAAEISPPQSIRIQFADGEIAATAGAPGAVEARAAKACG